MSGQHPTNITEKFYDNAYRPPYNSLNTEASLIEVKIVSKK